MRRHRTARGVGAFLVLVFLALPAAPRSAGGTCDTWWQHDPATAGDWFVEDNWSNGVPHGVSWVAVDNGGTAVISSGGAAAHYLYPGYLGDGAILQNGGDLHVMGGMYLAFGPGTGTYILNDPGTLWAGWEGVGWFGHGTFIQTGGSHTVGAWLKIGFTSTTSLDICGSGTYVQSGGVTSAWDIEMACGPGTSASYTLSGTGALDVRHMLRVGPAGTATFTQTGGTNTIGMTLAVDSFALGSYQLSGTGILSSQAEFVGWSHTGAFTQTGGTNTFSSSMSLGIGSESAGRYDLSGTGALSGPLLYVARRGTGAFAQSGGTSQISGEVYLAHEAGSSGAYELSGAATLSAGSLYVGYEGTGRLDIDGAGPTVTIYDLLRFGPDGTLTAGTGAAIHMTGADLQNASADPVALAGLGDLTLIFEGGSGVTAEAEPAGRDLGAVPAAWDANFALGTLQLGGADCGRIRLVDATDNQPDWEGGEALYTGTLLLHAGAAVDLNGLNLYYRNGGEPKQLFCGDATLDGRVDYVDLGILATYYDTSGATWARCDFSGDQVVDYVDLGVLATNYGKLTGGPPPVPAPAAAVLLAAGTVALLRRRRMA